MPARARLLLLTGSLGAAAFALAPPPALSPPPAALLQGAWVLDSVEIAGVVAPQLRDAVELERARQWRLPERREEPVDPLAAAVVTTFAGAEFVTRQGGVVVARGRFRLAPRGRPAILETRGVRYERIAHPASESVFAAAFGPVRSRIQVTADTLTLSTAEGVVAGGAVPADVVVVATFRRPAGRGPAAAAAGSPTGAG